MKTAAAMVIFLLLVAGCGAEAPHGNTETQRNTAPEARDKPFVDPVGLAELLQECAREELSMDEAVRRVGWLPSFDSRAVEDRRFWIPMGGWGGFSEFEPVDVYPDKLSGIMYWNTHAKDLPNPAVVGIAWKQDGSVDYFEAYLPTP
jgi:hypothetical protein